MNPMARAFLFPCAAEIALVPLTPSAQTAKAPGVVEAVTLAKEAESPHMALESSALCNENSRQQTSISSHQDHPMVYLRRQLAQKRRQA